MRTRSTVVTAFLLAVMPFAALAQPANKTQTHGNVEPPPMQKVLANMATQPNGALATVVAAKPEIPLGPLDVLKGYENEMTLVAQRMSAEVASISQAVQGQSDHPGAGGVSDPGETSGRDDATSGAQRIT